jgi:uncharacterized protein YmfQ (DUF2313 family)
LQSLLPQGRAWPRDEDATLTALLRGLAKSMADAHTRQINLLVDGFPATTEELLPEWEATLGLPDPCAGPLALVSERVAQVVARIKGKGGQSIPYYIQFAADLGYTITITEFAPYRVGHPIGVPIFGEAWAHAWEVNAPAFTVRYFRTGIDTAGTPLADWAGGVLACELNRIKPGQTILFFS